jgi:hypothetical protein
MPSRRDLTFSQPSNSSPVSAEDLKRAAILAQADRDCDAGLGLRGQNAKTFLGRVLDDARARVAIGKGA